MSEDCKNCKRHEKDNTLLMNQLMARTRWCPFGGSTKANDRAACRFGCPGCACDDWIASHREDIDSIVAGLKK